MSVFLRGASVAVLAVLATSLAPASSNAAIIFSENFDGAVHSALPFVQGSVPGWTLTPGTGSTALVLNSADYVANAGGTGTTGTGLFIAYSAGDSPTGGYATSPILALNAGQNYTLEFDYGVYGFFPQSLSVQFGAGVIGTVSVASGTTNLANVLAHYTMNFTASGPGSLTFTDTSVLTNSVDSFLDNIVVTTAVPEPSTWAMLLLGFAGLGFVGRHAQKARLRNA